MIPWHTHEGPTICLVIRGAFAEYSPGQVADCRPSTLKFMPAGERHWNRFHLGDVRGLMAELETERFAGDPAVTGALQRQSQFSSGPEVTLARRLYGEFRRTDSAAALAMEGLLLELLAQLARSGERLSRGDRPAWVVRARDLVHAHVSEPLSMGDIASAVGVHPATLARGFRRAYGCTIGEMQRQLRLEAAVAELAETGRPVAEVALRAGFYDQSHFTNLFRRTYGLTPARYRRAFAAS